MRARAASPLLTAKAVLARSTLYGVVFEIFLSEVRRVGKAQRAHHFHRDPGMHGGHGANAPLPTLRDHGMRLRHAFQKCLFRGLDRVGGSDVHPDAVEPQPEQPLLLVGAVEHFGQ
jgi:hypothetical protein